MKPKVVLLIALIGLPLAGCGDDRARADALQARVDQLEAELREIKTSPEQGLIQANRAYSKKQWTEVEEICRSVMELYPGSTHAQAAQTLLQSASEAKRLEAQERERISQQALAGLRKQYDKVNEITFWNDKSAPSWNGERDWIGAYLVKEKAGRPYLRLKITYTSEEWLFVDSYVIKVDDTRYELTPDSYGNNAVSRDNGSGDIWEWWDTDATDEYMKILRAISTGKSVTLRYSGDKYYHDHRVSESEKRAISRILTAYEIFSKTT